jgi:protein TonB
MNKLVLSFLLFASATAIVSSQTGTSNKTSSDSVNQPSEIFPEFPGGFGAMDEFIKSNLKYPVTTGKKKQETKYVHIEFVVDTDGSLVNPTVIKGVNPEMDAEALRVVRLMPKWNPGILNGRKVPTTFRLPIKFRYYK